MTAASWAALLFPCPLGEAAEPPATWPQWHGPNRDCSVGGPTWPTSLGKGHLQLLWHVDLGSGYPGPYGQYWSLAAQKDRILALDQRGELLLIRATPEKFDLLDSRKISDQETWGHLAVCGQDVFIRELNGISVYHWQ